MLANKYCNTKQYETFANFPLFNVIQFRTVNDMVSKFIRT